MTTRTWTLHGNPVKGDRYQKIWVFLNQNISVKNDPFFLLSYKHSFGSWVSFGTTWDTFKNHACLKVGKRNWQWFGSLDKSGPILPVSNVSVLTPLAGVSWLDKLSRLTRVLYSTVLDLPLGNTYNTWTLTWDTPHSLPRDTQPPSDFHLPDYWDTCLPGYLLLWLTPKDYLTP